MTLVNISVKNGSMQIVDKNNMIAIWSCKGIQGLDLLFFYEKVPALRVMTGGTNLKGIIPRPLAPKRHAEPLWFVGTCKQDQFCFFLFLLSISGLSTSSEMNFDLERVPRSSSNIFTCQYGRLIVIFLCRNSSAMIIVTLHMN